MSKKKIKNYRKIYELKNKIKQHDNNDKGKVKKSGFISNMFHKSKDNYIIFVRRKKADNAS